MFPHTIRMAQNSLTHCKYVRGIAAAAKETLFDNVKLSESQFQHRNATHTSKTSSHNENIIWSESLITPEERQKLIGAKHKGCTVWITGLSGSGKSTIAANVERELLEMGVDSYRLDGDNVRFGLCKDLGFSPEDREQNIRRVGEVAAMFADSGKVCITAFISPYADDRAKARLVHEKAGLDFVEVHADVSLEVAEKRDPKGLYKKARSGELKNFTGIDDRFDEPVNPEVKLQTDSMSVPACSGAIISELKARNIIYGRFRLGNKDDN